MRVTIDLPDHIHRQLKLRAAKEGTTMRALILKGIERVLQEKPSSAATGVGLLVYSCQEGRVTGVVAD